MNNFVSFISGVITAGISWDPEIRGFLTVVIAATALMGSIWLLLATNTGVRLGSLVAFAGFFGWFTIMATVWWIFGIGYAGQRPSWEYVETVKDPAGIEQTGIEDFIVLPDPNCVTSRIFPVEKTNWRFTPPAQGCTPRAIALVLGFDGTSRDTVTQELATIDEEEIRQSIEAGNALIDPSDPRFRSPDEIDIEVEKQVVKQEIVIDQLSLSSLAATAPEVITWAVDNDYLVLTDWRLLSTTESGEATNAASALITELGLFPSNLGAATPDFSIIDSYQKGGKSKRKSDGVWDRVTNRISTTFQLKHPPNEVVVQARAVLPREQVLGEAAPVSELDSQSETVSILLRRNLGNLRLTPGLIALGSGLIFTALALMLHVRHRREEDSGREEDLEATA